MRQSRKSLATVIVALAAALVPSLAVAQAQRGPVDGRAAQQRVRGERFDPVAAPELQPRRSATLGRYGRGGPALAVRLPEVPAADLLAPAAPRSKQPLQIGADRRIAPAQASPLSLPRLRWVSAGDGGLVAAFQVVSPGARAVRLSLRVDGLPSGAELRFFAPGTEGESFGPYDERDLLAPFSRKAQRRESAASGDAFWSPIVEGDGIGVEVYVRRASDRDLLAIELGSLSHLLYSPMSASRDLGDIGSSESCENDVACENLGNYVDSVAKIVFSDGGGTYMCTGQLVNDNDGGSSRPYFLTANHCIDSQSAASSIDFYWFFQRASCGGDDPQSVVQTTGGADLLHASSIDSGTDHALLLLREAPPAGTYLSGWATGQAGGDVVGVHHPAGDLKKVSFGSIVGTDRWSRQSFDSHYVVQWSSGVTEPGSSGSGLWRGNDLVGVLSGGSSYCSDPQAPDLYGRLDITLPDLSTWLDPGPLPAISAGQTEQGSVGRGAWRYWVLSTSGQPSLTATLETLAGDADLFLRAGAMPTESSFDCRSENPSLQVDECAVPATGGDVFVGVYGWESSDFRLSISGESAPVLPGQPAGISPAGTVEEGRLTYRWSVASDATSYRLQVREGGSVVLSETVNAAACGGSDCSSSPGIDLPDGSYAWSVVGINDAGEGGPSRELSFTVERASEPVLPGTPVGKSPAGTVDDGRLTYRWGVASDAASYRLQVRQGGSVVLSETVNAGAACGGSDCSSSPGIDLPDGNYAWSVAGINDAGEGAPSGELSFTVERDSGGTGGDLQRPWGLFPEGRIDEDAPEYWFLQTSGATAYEISIRSRQGEIFRQTFAAGQVCEDGVCVIGTPPAPELDGGRYEWSVRALDGNSSSPWSEDMRFVVDIRLGRARLLGPLGRIGDSSPTYAWEVVDGATEYEIRIAGPRGLVHRRIYSAAEICGPGSCAVGTPAVPELREGGYSWWVRARAGQSSGPRSARGRFWLH